MSSPPSSFRVVLALAVAGVTVSVALAAEHTVPLLPAASDGGPQGFVRVVNYSDVPGEIAIDAFDDTGRWFGPVLLSVGAAATVHFNSEDLQRGNTAKGLSGRTGSGAGDWRLTLSSALDIEVLAYVRTPDGFLTALNSVAPGHGKLHRVAIFNPGSNREQQSLLRLINPGRSEAEVAVTGVDDLGTSPGGAVRVSIPAGASWTIWADELETGAPGLDGTLGDGVGKWRLTIEANRSIMVMSLLVSPTLHITNLSAAPHRGSVVVSPEGVFRDARAEGGEGPEMTRIPAGKFLMGCLDGDVCRSEELPVREVTLARFAVSTNEITFADWEACADGGSCNGYRPDDEGWGKGARPVIHVGWDDAHAYVSWLSRSTGATYRLPSEAEWEYAARAGTRTVYSWGDDTGQGRANCRDDHCADGFPNTAPVGSFRANPWGLHDVHGNVSEWVQDCLDNARSYIRAPSDGSAWEYENCGRRMLRGGSWENSPPYVRVASRRGDASDARRHGLGFRIARTLVHPVGPGVVPLFPLASDRGPQGFVRVINHSDQGGAVRVDVFDDAGQVFRPLTLSLGPGEASHFNSDDLENGNSEKRLSGGVGPGTSAWRLELSSALDIEVLSYFRTPDGFLTAMHDIAPAAGNRHRIAIFNPGSNRDQQSILRLVNPGAQTAQVVIEGVDDSGRSPDGPVRVSLPAGAARNLTAEQLESGGSGLRGALGDGVGKWRLSVEADRSIMAMSLLESPTRHITNLSAAPQRGLAPDVFDARISADVVDSKCVRCHVEGGESGDTRLVFEPSGAPNRRALNRQAFRGFLAEVAGGADLILGKARGVDHGGGAQLRERSGEYADLEWFLTLLDEESSFDRYIADSGLDHDGDGITNHVDPDDDNDGVADTRDAFPSNAAEWADTNGNGQGDNREFLLSGRDPPQRPDPVEIAGEAILGAPLEGGRIDLTALNGFPIAHVETSSDGSFSITLSEALLPDWFLLAASGGQVRRVSDDGQEALEVRNRGTLRAYVGKRHLGPGRLRLGPWTEIAFQEVRLRHPIHGGLPSGLDANEILDGIAATLPDGGNYEYLLQYGSTSATEEINDALQRGIVDPIVAGAASNEVANRVATFLARFEEEGVVGDSRRVRRLETIGATRVLTVFSPDPSQYLAEMRQSFIDETGALVNARISRVNERDSTVRIDINHAGGRGIVLSGGTESLRGARYGRVALRDVLNAVVGLGLNSTGDALSVDIPKEIAEAISGGRLLFEVDGSLPRSDRLAIVRDDPIVEWNFASSTMSTLHDDGVHRLAGTPVRVLSNDDFLVLQFFREADRDKYSGFDGTAARTALYLWIAEEIAAGGLAHLSRQSWVKALVEAYSTYGRVGHTRSGVDYAEGAFASSRVNVNRRGSPADDRIAPGQEYGLDFFFDHTLTWEQIDRLGQTSVLPCPEYSAPDIERAIRDKAFRKGPDGAVADLPCHADIRLDVNQTDRLSYRADMPAPPDDSLFWLMRTCSDAGYDSYGHGTYPNHGKYYCHRVVEERSSRSVGTLTDLEHGFYWVIPEQVVRFGARPNLARAGEVVMGARMSLDLADDRGLFSRDLHYEVDLRGRELYPEFHGSSDGTSLILDARASAVGPQVRAEAVRYVWSYIRMEPGGEVIDAGDRQFHLLVPEVKWQDTASKPIFEVPLAELGVVGEEAEIQIRLEMIAGLMSEPVTKVVFVGVDAWNIAIFESLSQQAEQANTPDLKPVFESGAADLTLTVGTAMIPVQLPAASGGDGELTYSLSPRLPPGLQFSASTRRITGTPSQEGTWQMRYQVTDGDGDTDSESFTVSVTAG